MRELRDVALRLLASDRLTRLLDGVLAADRGRRDRCVVLTYHRVDEAEARPWLWPALLSATPSQFEEQMTLLAERMRPIPLEQLTHALHRGGRLPSRSVVVTIDDAYAGIEQHAVPVLARLGIPATLFVPTSFPGAPTGFWWDRLYHALTSSPASALRLSDGEVPLPPRGERLGLFRRIHDRLSNRPHDEILAEVARIEADLEVRPQPASVLDWGQLRQVAASGVTLAPHSHTHPRMDLLDPEAARSELLTSLECIHGQSGVRPTAFAYPAGFWSAPAAAAAREARLLAAFTTHRAGIDLPVEDPYRLPRINVGRRASSNALRMQLGRWMRFVGR